MDSKSDTKEVDVIKIPYGYGKKIAKKLKISETYLSTICNNGVGGILIRTKLDKELKKVLQQIKKEASK